MLETFNVEMTGFPPERERICGLIKVDRLGSEAVAVRDKELLNPLRPFKVRVEVVEEPTGKLREVGLADREKSVT